MPPDEGWETPRPWSQVHKAILDLELPEGQFFLVRYIRQSVRDEDGTNAEAAWPIVKEEPFSNEPFDIMGGILALGVASADGMAAIKKGWEEEFKLRERKE
ncbi:hypothetical protein HDU98_010675 [Podochytrium sp. JEL0797]|nr:hypothetical protein HDU98_010675 [Podochytrium sp. JEL0797]